jgi:NADH-quinone oxidoreductase subunit L
VGDALGRLRGEPGAPSATGREMALSGGLALVTVVAAAWLAPRLPAPAWARTWLGLSAAADWLVVRPVLALARGLARFDDRVLDRAVEASAPATVRLARAAARVDDAGVDGAVAALAAGTRRLGALARLPQTGQVHQYYAQAVVVLTAAVVLLVLVVR